MGCITTRLEYEYTGTFTMSSLVIIDKKDRPPRSEMNTIREAMHCSTLEAVFATIHIALTQGIFLTNYVLDLGASNFECGIVEALPFLLQFCFLFSPWLVRRLNARKPVAGFFAFAHRMSWLVLILLLYVDWVPWVKHLLMLITLLFSNACAVIAHNAWFSWMADLVPATIRGSYYGRRNAYMGLTSLVALLTGSQILNHYRQTGYGYLGYTVCFSAAIFSAFLAARMILKQYEPPPKEIPRIRIGRLLKTLHNKPLLKKYIVFFTVWQFSLGVGAAFFGIHMVKVLKMSVAQMGMFSLIASIMVIVASRFWGLARDRVGDRAILIATGIFISSHVWIWMPAEEGRLWPAWTVCIVGGFFWAGFNIASFSWPQHLCGHGERQYTFGMIGLFSGPGFVLGSLLGGVLTTWLPLVLFRLGDFEVLHFHLVFAISAIGRGVAILMIAHWSRPYDHSNRSVLQCLIDTFQLKPG
jgi:MFS family permease